MRSSLIIPHPCEVFPKTYPNSSIDMMTEVTKAMSFVVSENEYCCVQISDDQLKTNLDNIKSNDTKLQQCGLSRLATDLYRFDNFASSYYFHYCCYHLISNKDISDEDDPKYYLSLMGIATLLYHTDDKKYKQIYHNIFVYLANIYPNSEAVCWRDMDMPVCAVCTQCSDEDSDAEY